MEASRERWREEQQCQAALQRPPAYRRRVPHRQQPPSRLPRQPVAAVRHRPTDPSTPREPTPARPDLPQQLAAFQAALPVSRGEAYLHQRGIPLALAQQLGVGYAAPDACRMPHGSGGMARSRTGAAAYAAGRGAGTGVCCTSPAGSM